MFKPGSPKPAGSGRKPGQIAKLTLTARQKLEELGCDPLEGMATIAMDENNSAELRGKMYSELSQYVFPKLKAIDHTFGGSGTLNHHDSGTELLASRIASLAAKLGTGSGDPKPE